MRMTIDRMVIQNFKGVRELSIDFGDVTRISGMNGTGKTTIPDAFSWVLWNKDSRGNAPGSYDFREKPLDENGDEIHYLDTTVELFCKLILVHKLLELFSNSALAFQIFLVLSYLLGLVGALQLCHYGVVALVIIIAAAADPDLQGLLPFLLPVFIMGCTDHSIALTVTAVAGHKMSVALQDALIFGIINDAVDKQEQILIKFLIADVRGSSRIIRIGRIGCGCQCKNKAQHQRKAYYLFHRFILHTKFIICRFYML